LELSTGKITALMSGLIILLTFLVYWQLSLLSENYDDQQYMLNISGFSYDLNQPNTKYKLVEELNEISGLGFYSDSTLACIQDEKGHLYFYNLEKNKIIREEDFGSKGDYEGVEIIDQTAYVLKSNGNVYHFDIFEDDIGEVSEIETDLSSSNDTEGLAFNHASNQVLIICKNKNDTKNFETDDFAIYSIEWPENKFNKTPAITYSNEKLRHALDDHDLDKKKHLPFKPSAIAVHPITDDIIILSSVGKLMVVLDQSGQIKNVSPLKRSVFSQPEGICFDQSGVMYISNEGRGKSGDILQFQPLF